MRKYILVYALTYYVLVALFFFPASPVSGQARFSGDSVFKGWYFTPTAVHGIIPLAKWANRSFSKISRQGAEEYIIRNYNPAGIVMGTIYVDFTRGKISRITKFNRWGQAVDSTWFRELEANEFYVTEKLLGQNPNAPCLGQRYVFKDDLLQDIYCMRDSTKTGNNQEGVAHYVFERYRDVKRFSLVKSESYYGDIDNPVISRISGCHRFVSVYDENGNLTTKTLYGLNDEQVTDRAGNSLTRMKYDKNDNEIETAYFDIKGSPWNEYLGCAYRGYEYKNGLVEKETFYHNDYSIARSRRVADSVAMVTERHNEYGDLVEKAFFDENDFPINNQRGIHRFASQFNSSGMLTDFAVFDKKNYPASDETGIHRYHFEFDNRGQIAAKTQFDANDMAVIDSKEGVFEIKYQYDNWGRISSYSFWTNDSVKMTGRMGYQQVFYQYDPAGRVSQVEYFDGEKKDTSPKLGYSREAFVYNDQELMKERKYFKGDKPVSVGDSLHAVSGFSIIKYTYDFYNREYSLEYFDENGNPVNARLRLKTGSDLFCQKIEFSYQGEQAVAETFFDKNNSPLRNSDCMLENCVLLGGNEAQMKNQVRVTVPKPTISSKIPLIDSVFFANQISLLFKDSILIFLNEDGSRLSEIGCATFYRTVGVNKYFQLQGEATDHYIDGDTLAARLRYDNGQLRGHAVYYYKNGKVKEKGDYEDNHRAGVWNYYYENGLPYKTILFSDRGMALTDFFSENGDPLVKDGNGKFTGLVALGKGNNAGTYSVTGLVKNGLQEGDWTVSVKGSGNPVYIEKFSSGRFKKGTAHGYVGESNYWVNPVSSFESLHPAEKLDHYGQNNFCSLYGKGNRTNINSLINLRKDFYPEIHQGIEKILQTNEFKDYSGWAFLYIHFNQRGLLSGKSVFLYRQNDRFKNELLKMLGQLGEEGPQETGKSDTGVNKFYVVLVENNQMVIPEELLANAR
jgi:hypothetical protein